MKRCITEAKRTEERSWLGDVSASMLQQSVRDLSQAFRNWWQGKGRVRAPNFKKRGNRQSIRAGGKEFYPTETGVWFLKIGVLRLRWSRPLPSEPSSVTIIAARLNACGVKSKSSLLVSDPEAGTRLDQGVLVPPEERESPSVTAERMSKSVCLQALNNSDLGRGCSLTLASS